MTKTLIELMLEANIEWPEGAEYAAQDKATNSIYCYDTKPKREGLRWGDGITSFGQSKAFAEAIGWWPANVSNWLKAGYIITTEGWIINPNTTKRDMGETK